MKQQEIRTIKKLKKPSINPITNGTNSTNSKSLPVHSTGGTSIVSFTPKQKTSGPNNRE